MYTTWMILRLTISAVDCKWGEWELWGDCPSGCDQEKTRVRQMIVEASCNGTECDGIDYEKKICSREDELAEQIRALLDENETLEKNQCPTGSEGDIILHFNCQEQCPFCILSLLMLCTIRIYHQQMFLLYFDRWKMDDV